MRALLGRLPLLASVFVSGACHSSGGDDAGAEIHSGAGSLALVSVERFVDPDGGTMRVVAGAKVARYHRIGGEALLSLLGAETVELETCSSSSGLTSPPVSPAAEVELLSVGQMTLKTGDAELMLEPRLFPALAATASGWFYANDAEIVAPRVELDDVFLRAPGNEALGAFELAVAAPRELVDVQLDGSALVEVATIRRGDDLQITWEADDPRDRVEIELLAGGTVVSCACRDDGHFVIERSLLGGIDTDDNGALVLRRVRGAAFDMQGVDAAYARIATTRSEPLVLR